MNFNIRKYKSYDVKWSKYELDAIKKENRKLKKDGR